MDEDKLFRVLKILKGLTGKEAKGIIEIIKKKSEMKKEEIVNLFIRSNVSSKSNAYNLIERLISKKVLMDMGENTFQAINPELILYDCRNSLNEVEQEIQGFELELGWIDLSEKEKSKVIKQDHDILSYLHNIRNHFKISFKYNKKDKKHGFWESVKMQFKDCKISEGIYNCVILEDDEKELPMGGVIILSKDMNVQGEEVFFGSMIFDNKLIEVFNK